MGQEIYKNAQAAQGAQQGGPQAGGFNPADFMKNAQQQQQGGGKNDGDVIDGDFKDVTDK